MEEQLVWYQESKEETLQRQVEILRVQCDRIRKSLFAKHGELLNLYLETRQELDVLKSTLNMNNNASSV
jgi:hypothetical protein